MKKLFLLLAASAVVLLLSCDPVNKDNPDLPENYDIEFVANEVEALAIPPLAAGWLLDIETDYHILTLNMSDNGYDSFGMEKPNSTYFIVGFFYDVPDDGSDVITVADSTYEYVPGGVAAGNIVIEICSYTKTGEALGDGDVEYLEDLYYTDAALTVSSEGDSQKFDFVATLEDGRTVHAVYTGNVYFDEVDIPAM